MSEETEKKTMDEVGDGKKDSLPQDELVTGGAGFIYRPDEHKEGIVFGHVPF